MEKREFLPTAWVLFFVVISILTNGANCTKNCSDNPCDDFANCTDTDDGCYTCECQSTYAGDAYGCDLIIVDFDLIMPPEDKPSSVDGLYRKQKEKWNSRSVWANEDASLFLYNYGGGEPYWEISPNPDGGSYIAWTESPSWEIPVTDDWCYNKGSELCYDDSYPVRCVKNCTSVESCRIEEPCDENCTLSDIGNGDIGFDGDGFCLEKETEDCGTCESCHQNATCTPLTLGPDCYAACISDQGNEGDGPCQPIATTTTEAPTTTIMESATTTEAAEITDNATTTESATTTDAATATGGSVTTDAATATGGSVTTDAATATGGSGTTDAATATGGSVTTDAATSTGESVTTDAATTTGSVNTTGSGASNSTQLAGGSIVTTTNGLLPLPGGSGASCTTVSLGIVILLFAAIDLVLV